MSRPKLTLEVSLGRADSFEGMESTYRREGLTVGADYMRIDGVKVDVSNNGGLLNNSVF